MYSHLHYSTDTARNKSPLLLLSPANTIRGVALTLKDLLSAFTCDIDHESESCIRRKLRKRSDVKATASQFFLKSAAVSLDLDRKNCDSKSCILIPRDV